MTKLPKCVFEFVYAKGLDRESYSRFELWLNTYAGEYHRWTDNQQVLIPYEVYECWLRYEEDQMLLQKLKEVMKSL